MATSTYQNMTLDQLINELAYLKKTWTADNKEYINGLAADVRFVAAMKGFDTRKLEQEAVKKAAGREPNASDWAGYDEAMKIVNASVAIGKLKQQWSPNNTAAADEAQKLRVEYRTQGLSLREIEAYAMQYADPSHKTPTNDALEYSMAQGARAADYAGRLALAQKEWNDAKNNPNLTAAQKKAAQDASHQKAQNIRIQALQNGQDLWEIEELAFFNRNGRAMTAAERAAAASYIDPLLKEYGKKPATGSSVPSTATPKTSAPTRTRTGNGETWSGADMVVYMAFPNARPIMLGTATTISYTMFREKKQVRTVGKIGPRGFAKGPRTISGRMIFTVINEHLVETIRREISYLRQYKYLFMDELPPFDLIISFGNEYGGAANMMITGVAVVDEQKTLSIEDLFIENIFTYLARDLQVMRDMNIDIKEPYTPLDILSSYFNALGSEMVGNFKIDDLVLSDKAQAVTGYNPFTVMPETFQYTWLDQIAQLEAPLSTGDDGGSIGYQSPVFIQVYDTRTKKLLTQGYFDLNGESPSPDMILSYTSQQLKYWSAASLKAGSDGKYYGYFGIMDLAPGTELQVAWSRTGYTQVTKTATISSSGTYVLLETASSATNTQDEVLHLFENDEAQDWSGKKSPKTILSYADSAKIKVAEIPGGLQNNYNKNSLTSVEHVSDLSKYQLTPCLITKGGPLGNWPLYITWELSKAIVDGTDNWYNWTDGDDAKKLNAIDKDGFFSSTINPKLGKPKETVVRTLDTMGYAEINPDDIFATRSTKGATLRWKDMPEGMLLYIRVYTDSRIGNGRWPGYLMYVFRRNN